LELKTKEISDYSGKGQHTTTFAQMHDLNFGGSIIDTPGIKSLSFINMEPMDVAHNFKEFFKASANCKFSNCLHINEPKCAVKAGLETGEISELRYANYMTILNDIQNQNHWERNKEL
jgi:ribosome biogenesis GTPase